MYSVYDCSEKIYIDWAKRGIKGNTGTFYNKVLRVFYMKVEILLLIMSSEMQHTV